MIAAGRPKGARRGKSGLHRAGTFREEDRCKKKNSGEILGCQENLLICFVHPVLLMLRLAELAALSYGSGVIVAQMVKVRLIAVVAGLNSHLHAVLFHSKFSSLTFIRIL